MPHEGNIEYSLVFPDIQTILVWKYKWISLKKSKMSFSAMVSLVPEFD
jgi:hypothetical protein